MNIFRKKRIKYLGLNDLIFSYESNSYYIGSELLSFGDYDIEIYKDQIWNIKDGFKKTISKSESSKVLLLVKGELEKSGLRVYIKSF